MTQVKDNTKSHKGTHLTCDEMVKIEGHKENSLSNRQIAELLGRSCQTINDAVKTGVTIQKRQ